MSDTNPGTSHGPSEAEIADLYSSGYAHAYRIVGNHDDALDVVQDSMVRALDKWKQFYGRNGATRKTWFTQITINQARDFLKQRKRKTNDRIVDEFEPIATSGEFQEIDWHQLFAVARLTNIETQCVQLRCAGHTHAEIVDMLSLHSVGAAMNHFHRAQRKLKTAWEKLYLSD